VIYRIRSRDAIMGSALACLLALSMPASAVTPASVASADEAADEQAIRQALIDGCKSFVAMDMAGAAAPFLNSPEFMVFDFTPPQQKDYAQHKAETFAFPDLITGTPVCEYLEIHPRRLSADTAYSWALMRFATSFKDGRKIDVTFRSTDVWRKVDGAWKIAHEHNSFPVDIFTGKAVLDSFAGTREPSPVSSQD
jgi:ketosteroid isomerase-like protein